MAPSSPGLYYSYSSKYNFGFLKISLLKAVSYLIK